MDKNKRLKELTEKYKENSLTKAEYREFLCMLDDSGNLEELDKQVTSFWYQMDEGIAEGEVPVMQNRKRNLMIWSAAASVLILVASAILYFSIPGSNSYHEYKTGFGEVKEVTLPDGSVVTINANSKLSWNDKWKREGARRVILDGEAFFDIKNLHGMAFSVEADDVSVEVVGTSFNVDSRNQKTDVYLDEGKVKLHMDQDSGTIVMEPGDRVKYDAVEKKIEKTENESLISAAPWKKGILNFKDMKFRDVLDKLSVIYGITFICNDEALLSKRIYLGVPYAEWQSVKEALELSLDIRMAGLADTYIISRE